jgi:hypothetical protein
MIGDFVITELKARIPDVFFMKNSPPRAVAVFPAAHPSVGDLAIYDDGTEARVHIGKITHGHFGCGDGNLNQSDREKDIANGVVDFVEAVFRNQVIFFSSLDGRSGGWQVGEFLAREKSSARRYFTWAGPLTD